MTQAEDKNKIDYFKWVITIMVTIVLGVTVMNANILTSIRATQAQQQADIARITAIQAINTEAISKLNQRVSNIESDKIAEVKQWALETFVQKR